MNNKMLKIFNFNTITKFQESVTIVPLEYFQCFVTDFPELGIDCSLKKLTVCVSCKIMGAYLIGEKIDDKAFAYLIRKIVLIISFVVGIIGVLANILTIVALNIKRSKNKSRAFDLLLLYLAYAGFSAVWLH